MPKSFLFILAALPLLIAALVFGRQHAPRGCDPHAIARSSVHARVALHAPSHDRTTIDDDDEYDDDDVVEAAMLAPQTHESDDVSPDPTSDERSASATRSASTTTAASLRMTGRGIRPSGEHRSAADKPPRS